MADEFNANDSSPVKRGDYGVKVARKGYDARYCEDNQLLFNSNWPILQVVGYIKKDDAILLYEETDPIPAGYTLYEEKTFKACGCDLANIYTKIEVKRYVNNDDWTFIHRRKLYGRPHNLGYIPMYLPVKMITADFELTQMREYGGYETLLGWDLTNIDSDVVLFNVDLYEDRDYPYTAKPTNVYFKVTDYGFKSGREGFAVPKGSSSDGVGVSANLQSKMVQAVKTMSTCNESTIWEQVPLAPPQEVKVKQVTYDLPNDFDAEDLEFFAYCSSGPTTDSIEYLDNIETKWGKVYFMCGYEIPNTMLGWNMVYYKEEEDGQRRITVRPWDNGTDVDIDCKLVVVRSPMSSPEIEVVRL